MFNSIDSAISDKILNPFSNLVKQDEPVGEVGGGLADEIVREAVEEVEKESSTE